MFKLIKYLKEVIKKIKSIIYSAEEDIKISEQFVIVDALCISLNITKYYLLIPTTVKNKCR